MNADERLAAMKREAEMYERAGRADRAAEVQKAISAMTGGSKSETRPRGGAKQTRGGKKS